MTISFRTTEQSVAARTLAGLRGDENRMQRLRDQISTGKQLTRPSDSPAGTMSAMQLRSELAARQRYARSTTDGLARLGTAEDALTSSSTLLNRARDLVLQGMSAPASASPSAREALATEIDSLRESLISLGNTTYLDRPVFGGTTAQSRAFDDNGGYLGDGGEVTRRVADGVTVRVDVPASAFGTGTGQVFDVLRQVATDLRTNPAALTGDLDRLDSGMRTLNTELSRIGTRYGQLTAARDASDAQVVGLASRLSEIEDADLAKAIIDLETQSVGYQAALAATARVLQPSLLDFLR